MKKQEQVTAIQELTKNEPDAVAGGTVAQIGSKIVTEVNVMYNGSLGGDKITFEPKLMYDIKK